MPPVARRVTNLSLIVTVSTVMAALISAIVGVILLDRSVREPIVIMQTQIQTLLIQQEALREQQRLTIIKLELLQQELQKSPLPHHRPRYEI